MATARRPAFGALVVAALAAPAHHGIAGSYDSSRSIVLAGTVTNATSAPRHPVVSVEVEAVEPPEGDAGRPDEVTGPFRVRPEDVGAVREVEFLPMGTFHGLPDRLAFGDRVVVLALRDGLPPPGSQLLGPVRGRRGGLLRGRTPRASGRVLLTKAFA